jgi:hypothetical protein
MSPFSSAEPGVASKPLSPAKASSGSSGRGASVAVAFTPHGLDAAIVWFELAAEFLDVDIYRPQPDKDANTLFDKLCPREGTAGLTYQHRQKLELCGRHNDFAETNLHGRPVRKEMVLGLVGRAGHVMAGTGT